MIFRTHLRQLRGAFLVLAALVVGCSGEGPAAPADPASVSISTPASSLGTIGATLQLNATAQNTTSLPTWTSSSAGVASVSSTGFATAVANGTTIMTASVPGASATVLITVAAGPTGAEIAAVISAAGKLSPGPVRDDSTRAGADVLSADSTTRYTPWQHSEAKNVRDILNLGINESLIWPGQLIYGTGASTFVYDDIPVERGAVTISLNLEGVPGTENLSRTIADPKLSTMRQGINELLAGVTSVPAASNFSYEAVYSAQQLRLAVSANASIGPVDIASKFNFTTANRKTRIVAKFQQVYFSVDIDRPISPSAFIKPGTSLAAVQAAFPAGSQPMYVAGVKYGWMAVMVIESSESEQATSAALAAAYSGLHSAEVAVGTSSRQLLQNATIETFVYGGSTAALANLPAGYEGFLEVINTSVNFNPSSPGLPLVYTFANMSDNTNALVNLAADYTVNVPLRIRENIKVTVNEYFMVDADDEGGFNAVEIDRLSMWVHPFNKASVPTSNIYPSARNVHNYSSGGDGWVTDDGGYFPFLPLEGASFTIPFDTDPLKFLALNTSKIDFSGYARDYDDVGDDEYGDGYLTLLGANYFDNAGRHTIFIVGADFNIRATVTITRVP